MLEKFEKLKDMKLCDLEQNEELISKFFDEKKKMGEIWTSMTDKLTDKFGVRGYGLLRNEFRKIVEEKKKNKIDKDFDFDKEEFLYCLVGFWKT